MDLNELEELIAEYMPGLSIEKNRKGEIVIYTNLKEAEEGGELVPLEEEEIEAGEDPDFDDVEPYSEEDDDE